MALDVRRRTDDDVDEGVLPRLRPIEPTEDSPLPDRLQPIGASSTESDRLQPIVARQSRPEPGSSEEARVEIQRLEDEKAHPWGTPENHPGRLGRIGHVLGRIGNVAGDILIPRQMEMIPGTDLNRAAREEAARERLGKAQTEERAAGEAKSKEELEGAQKTEAEARAENLKNPPEEWNVAPNAQGPNGELIEVERHSGQFRYGQPGTTRTKETQEQNKLEFQAITGKLDKAGLPTGPAQLDKSLDTGLKKGIITADEHAKARSYQSANPTPGTNLTVHIAGQEAGQDIKDRNAKALIDNPDGSVRMGTVAEAKAAGHEYLPVKDEQQIANTGRLYNQIRRSTDRLADPKLLKIFDDPAARAIVATAMSDTEATHFGAVVPGVGGLMLPVPGGIGRFLDSVLQNYKGPNREELKDYLANTWEAKEAVMNMMRLQTEGKQGVRSQQQIAAIVAQLPNGATPDSKRASMLLRNLYANLDDYGRAVPDKLPGYEKYQPKFTSKDLEKRLVGGGEQPETKTHGGFEYTKGADGQWHKGKAVQQP